MSDNSRDPLSIPPDMLDQIFGGIKIDSDGLHVTSLTPKCARFEEGPNNFGRMTLPNTCGRCKHFRQRVYNATCKLD